jgi:ubiquinone/menaquinone biosynthesis C-methylase UbiE
MRQTAVSSYPRRMSLRKNLFAATYDRMSRNTEEAGLCEMRHGLLASADGNVLEIGGGTGANLGHYDGKIESLVVTEPEPAMLRRLQKKARAQAPLAKILRAPAEDLPFEDDSFDTVVSTLVLCGVDDQSRSLRELRRVLRPGGQLLFLEHVRSDDPALARFQDRMNWLNRLVVQCDCNRPTLAGIRAAGFTISRLEQTTFPKAPKFARPMILGTAIADNARYTDSGSEAQR